MATKNTKKTQDVDPSAAVERLRDALNQAGIVLPSLWLDNTSSPNMPLVQLGRVRPDVALRLADALRQGVRKP